LGEGLGLAAGGPFLPDWADTGAKSMGTKRTTLNRPVAPIIVSSGNIRVTRKAEIFCLIGFSRIKLAYLGRLSLDAARNEESW